MLLPTIASVTALAEAMTFAPGGRHPVQQRPLWQAKMKADHGGANLLDQRAEGLVERRVATGRGCFSRARASKSAHAKYGSVARFCLTRSRVRSPGASEGGEPTVIDLKGSHFERDIILWGVRWYVAYPISYRQLEEMMEERGVEVDDSTVNSLGAEVCPATGAGLSSSQASGGHQLQARRDICADQGQVEILIQSCRQSRRHG